MRSVEDDFWWYRGLRGLACRQVVRAVRGLAAPRVLDAGCGTGGMMRALCSALPEAVLTGVDLSPRAVELAGQRAVGAILEAPIECLPFGEGSFDAAVCLDVLYIDSVNEHTAARELRRVLKTGGRLILNLPAFECLRGEHDRAVHTARRYTKMRARRLLEEAGLIVEKLFYWNALFFPALAVWRPLSGFLSRGRERVISDLRPFPRPLNAALGAYLEAETRFAARCGLPFGSSVFAVAVK